MNGVKTPEEVLPESFASIEEAAEWWDTHSTADDWDQTREVHFEVDLPRKPRRVTLEEELADRLAIKAQKQNISLETLVNLWLQEKWQEKAHTA